MVRIQPLALAAVALATCYVPPVAAQASCSSDGVPRPTAVFERFISADCEACWADPATPAPGPSAVVLDWIVPTALGDEAPLAAAATNDALLRLQALGRAAPGTTDVAVLAVEGTPAHRVRVAHGLPLNDYLGTGIAFKPHQASPAGTWQYHLLLVESVPAGAEGTPVERNLVRSILQGTWGKRHQLSKAEQSRTRFAWMENRPMRIPEGAKAEHLSMVGWVQNAQGEVVAAAQSACR